MRLNSVNTNHFIEDILCIVGIIQGLVWLYLYDR